MSKKKDTTKSSSMNSSKGADMNFFKPVDIIERDNSDSIYSAMYSELVKLPIGQYEVDLKDKNAKSALFSLRNRLRQTNKDNVSLMLRNKDTKLFVKILNEAELKKKQQKLAKVRATLSRK